MYKEKKQFRLYDVYRCYTTGKTSWIKGIYQYNIAILSGKYHLVVQFANGNVYDNWCDDEKDLKKVITSINKVLKNCLKPGKKKKEY